MTVEEIRPKIAVVLAGAVAKGAFEAGALLELARKAGPKVHVTRIVAASSGALNAAVYGAGVRHGIEESMAETLVELWESDARFCKVFSAGWGNLSKAGFSNGDKLRGLLADNTRPPMDNDKPRASPKHSIELRIMLTPLLGRSVPIGKAPFKETCATTFEAKQTFDGSVFDHGEEQAREEMFDAAIASAAFPIAFTTVEITKSNQKQPNHEDLGRCVDGGTTNNAPIGEAIESNDVCAVLVIAPTVEHVTSPKPVGGVLDVFGRVVDMLINERLFRDLRKAEEVNAEITRLNRLVDDGVLTVDQLRAVKDAIDWQQQRYVPIIRIRPEEALEGNPFAGFTCKRLRTAYIEAGRACARQGLARLDEVLQQRMLDLGGTDVAAPTKPPRPPCSATAATR